MKVERARLRSPFKKRNGRCRSSTPRLDQLSPHASTPPMIADTLRFQSSPRQTLSISLAHCCLLREHECRSPQSPSPRSSPLPPSDKRTVLTNTSTRAPQAAVRHTRFAILLSAYQTTSLCCSLGPQTISIADRTSSPWPDCHIVPPRSALCTWR